MAKMEQVDRLEAQESDKMVQRNETRACRESVEWRRPQDSIPKRGRARELFFLTPNDEIDGWRCRSRVSRRRRSTSGRADS